jgi:hypothetical protein
LTKKAVLIFIGTLVLTLCFARLYVPNASLTNAANKFAVISIANISNEKAAPVFENAGVKAEVLADGNRSFLYIKDVGNSWKEKTFEIRSSEAGEIEIVLSGAYEGLSDSPTIFIDWRNLTIDGKAVFEGEKTGRNDRAALAFKQKIASGQVLKIGVEYRNGITYLRLFREVNYFIFVLVFLILLFILLIIFLLELGRK